MAKNKHTLELGQRFNGLTYLSDVHTLSGNRRCLWQCTCGNIKEITLSRVLIGNCKSCGCAQHSKLPAGEAGFNLIYYKYQMNAKRRKYEFNLDIAEFRKLISSNCDYCGEEPSNISRGGNLSTKTNYSNHTAFKYNGIDRINNQIGYTSDNCVPCCKNCNIAKRCLSKQDYYQWIKELYLHLHAKGEI